jgi:hypothetical protein
MKVKFANLKEEIEPRKDMRITHPVDGLTGNIVATDAGGIWVLFDSRKIMRYIASRETTAWHLDTSRPWVGRVRDCGEHICIVLAMLEEDGSDLVVFRDIETGSSYTALCIQLLQDFLGDDHWEDRLDQPQSEAKPDPDGAVHSEIDEDIARHLSAENAKLRGERDALQRQLEQAAERAQSLVKVFDGIRKERAK